MTDTNVLPIPLLQTLGISETEFRKQARSGKLTLTDIAKAILPGTAAVEKVTPAPLPVALTEKQHAALTHIVEVFGSVVPSKVRKLNGPEIERLLDERQTIDTILTMAEDRKKDIRTTILNHIDSVTFDETDAISSLDREGHVLYPVRVPVPNSDQEWSWEISTRDPGIDPNALKALVESGELDNKDYLAMTIQTRVVDEHAIMSLLAKKPSLLNVVTKAATPGRKTGSLFVRKAKAVVPPSAS